MSNKSTFKALLSAVQKIYSITNGKILDDELINEMRIYTPPLMNFYSIGHFQSIVLSLYIECALREVDVDMDKLINHFGKDLTVLADINESIEGLYEKKLISVVRNDFTRTVNTTLHQQYELSNKAFNALIKGDSNLLETIKPDSFMSLLNEVKELFRKRMNDGILTDILTDEIKSLLETNKNYPEVKWLLSWDNLNKYDLAILLNITINHLEGVDVVDIDTTLKEVFSGYADRVKYKKAIKENINPLIKNGIIEFDSDSIIYLNYVKVSEESITILLGDFKESIVEKFTPKMGAIINPNKIAYEALFYNTEEKEQIDLLKDALSENNYQQLMCSLKESGMKEGFTVLLHGYPGTGKTSSVKQIAKATGRDIFMVEIEKIKSKWVGESEKNVAKVFEEYKKCKKNYPLAPILLFNEADAILGKRFNVTSSVDKSFNTIQNLLLQELEDFEGIFMATTNLANQLDEAFDRRLLYKIEFKKPKEVVRKKILKSAFKGSDDVLIDKLNQYALTGGQISNIKKKLLIHNILKHSKMDNHYLFQLCEAELSLSKSNKNPIGFLKN